MTLGMPEGVRAEFEGTEKSELINDLWERLTREEQLYEILYDFAIRISEDDSMSDKIRREASQIIEILDDDAGE